MSKNENITVGMPCSISKLGETWPAVVSRIISDTVVAVKPLKFKKLSKTGLAQEYSYSENPKAEEFIFSKRKQGYWVLRGEDWDNYKSEILLFGEAKRQLLLSKEKIAYWLRKYYPNIKFKYLFTWLSRTQTFYTFKTYVNNKETGAVDILANGTVPNRTIERLNLLIAK